MREKGFGPIDLLINLAYHLPIKLEFLHQVRNLLDLFLSLFPHVKDGTVL